MTNDGQSIERAGISANPQPETRAVLIAEFARGLLRGEEMAGGEGSDAA